MADDTRPRSIHVTGYASHSVSTDGTTAMIVFEVADGSHFAITLPVDHLNAVRTGLTALIELAGNRSGNALPRFLGRFDVGHSDNIGSITAPNGKQFSWRDMVIMRFDAETENEVMYLFTKKDGLTMSDRLKQDIMRRMSPQERREWYTKDSLKAPPPKKLIVP